MNSTLLNRRRKPNRMVGYDYTIPGVYFITVVTEARACLFGEVYKGELKVNDSGLMIAHWWAELANKFSNICPGMAVVMPNHFHGLIEILDPVEAGLRAGLDPQDTRNRSTPVEAGLEAQGASLPDVMQWFKTMTTNEYMRGVRSLGWPRFDGKLWQRSYYDHIVRDQRDYELIYQYIQQNPAQWETDQEYPSAP